MLGRFTMTFFWSTAWVLSHLVTMQLIAQEPTPPIAAKKSHAFDFHGVKVEDPYFWIKDKKNPDVISFLEAENAYREGITKTLKPFEESLYKEMLSHIKQTDLGVPVRENGFWYYSRTEAGKQYPYHCRKKAGRPLV